MSLTPPSNVGYLIDRYLDGQITAQEMDRLNNVLRSNASARREFAKHLDLDSSLAEFAASQSGEEAAVRDIVELNAMAFKRTTIGRILLSAAAVLALLVGSWWWYVKLTPFATVARSVATPGLADGVQVRHEPHQIKTGMVELITVRGARLVIEAPAEFFFESSQRLNMRSGRLTADVPPQAKGFTVITPAGKAIDLGTRFAIDISSETQSEVHVFEGEVVAQSTGSSRKQLLTAFTAVRLGGELKSTACDVRYGAFVGDREISAMAEAFRLGQRERAQVAKTLLQQDPAMLAWLDFGVGEEASPLQVGSQVIGARRVQGRFPGTSAIDFVNSEDCVKLDLDSRIPAFTLMAWVRLNQLEGRQNSLYSTDEWGELGQVHWMIGDVGRLRFAIKGSEPNANGDSNVWLESQPRMDSELQRWVHLAIAYDSNAGKAVQYLNGQAIVVAPMPKKLLAALGPAQVGNWKPKEGFRHLPRRRLSGRLDEFAAFARALSATEIADYFEASTPYK
ncbi:LamG-like jellyroll fold domain-containing protein [Aureliella helgolandensis]|uniref:FecR protein n=1 Tax=Aureliella helgolandensis TaxID=2527968 RepID=A0A518G2A8_9BACT|nr:LamG-like jellyroll fold domain-containing protein [Aureliella helgolandensis]QDV22731.1 FecR protein [Aureliella helgolandensis]